MFNGTAGDPNDYNPKTVPTDCYWIIQAPSGRKIQFQVTQASMCLDQCPWQSFDINLGNFQLGGMLLCCQTDVFTSTSNQISIRGMSLYNQLRMQFKYKLVWKLCEAIINKFSLKKIFTNELSTTDSAPHVLRVQLIWLLNEVKFLNRGMRARFGNLNFLMLRSLILPLHYNGLIVSKPSILKWSLKCPPHHFRFQMTSVCAFF